VIDQATAGVLAQIEKAKAFLDSFSGEVPVLEAYRDKASAWVAFFKHYETGLFAQNVAAELKIRLERKIGEMLPPARPAGRPRKGKTPGDPELSLIDSRDAAQMRKIASIPAVEFENYILTTKHEDKELTTAGVLRLWAALNRKPNAGEEVPKGVTPAPPGPSEEVDPAKEILAALTQVTRKLTVFINSFGEGEKFRKYVTGQNLGKWLDNRDITVRLDDGTTKTFPIRFRGFDALRWFIKLAGKKGVKTPAQVAALFKEAKGSDVEDWQGDA
jgi:hypothetical protein